jgi:hypothetical protein
MEKAFIAVPLMYASYITWTCPCDPCLACHKTEFYGALGLSAIAATIVLNKSPSSKGG